MRFRFSPAAGGAFKGDGLRPVFAYRDLGMGEATDGRYHAHVIRAADRPRGTGPDEGAWHVHDLESQMVYVLKGTVTFEYEGQGRIAMTAGDAVHQPPGIRHRLITHSPDMELLEITSPAEFATRDVAAPVSQE